MTMTLKQSDLYRFERLVSKLCKPSDNPTIAFLPHGGKLRLCAFAPSATLSMLVPRDDFADAFAMRWSDFKTVAAAKKGTDVTFELQKGAVRVRADEVLHHFLTSKKLDTPPHCPSQTATHSKTRLFDALTNAARCVDQNSVRNALTGICLRGATKQIVSTSGIQLLVQNGFDISTWGKTDVVCPVSKIFGSKELKEIDTDEVLIGLVAEHVYFSVGDVEIWLRTIKGNSFPKIDGLLEPVAGATFLTVHPTDVQFILDRIDKLPGAKNHEAPLYVSLNKKVQIRAHDCDKKTAIALELTHSTFTGEPLSFAMNRLFLKNALQLGCWRIGIDPTGDKPVICTGDDKTHVFVSLAGSEPEAEHTDIITTSMQSAVQSAVTPPKATVPATAPAPVKRRRRVASKRDTVPQPSCKLVLLQSAEAIRTDLRNSLVQVNALIREVKSQRQKDRLLQTTMDSLRKLSLA